MEEALLLSGERRMTREELNANVARAAGGFESLGVGEDDSVCLMLRNDFPFFEASMGATLAGAYAVPINWHNTADETRYILEDCDARALVIHADLLPRVAHAVPETCRVFVVATPPEIAAAYGLAPDSLAVPADRTDWAAWLAGQPPFTREPATQRTNMIYTSGTTGNPKGVRRDPADLETQARMNQLFEIVFGLRNDPSIRTVITGPMYHSAPNAYGLWSAKLAGLVILQPRFDAEELLALIEEHRITHVHMVPTMFVRLLKLPETVRSKYDLSSLEFVVHAAAPCPPDVKRRMIEWWGPVINEYYGGTETGAVFFHTAEEALKKPGTVGRALPWADVRIVDDGLKELPPGEIGEVYMRLMGWPDFTYNKNDAKRAEVGLEHLVSCGDVGFLDEDGYLFLCDRKRDMVISGGVNIYPAEIENTLIGMPGVKDCAVFGIPDDEYGESLAAHVQLEPGGPVSEADIRGWLSARLAKFKVPKRIVFEAELPRQDSGKIFKRKLREPYWEDAGRQI
ncbi:MAG: long-chain fatty acid--CoA ligase [Rhizobiales bacterium NRL2]|jgi:long-chain acyl-CoA synthetase|nr:MAG: long-chain fatty acid--CoA ligase [Rhizobiales bacterium NRL2]